MDIDKGIEIILKKGFTVTTGGIGIKIIFTDVSYSHPTLFSIEFLAIGSLLLLTSTILSYLTWRQKMLIL